MLDQYPPPPNSPLRVVLQTKTHLVPGDEFSERCRNMKNLICRHLWDRDFDHRRDRWSSHLANFGYDNRTCYFLLDHGQCTGGEAAVPVLWFKWTGTSFVAVQKPLPHRFRLELERRPFYQARQPPPATKRSREPLDAATRRQIIRSRLRSNMRIPETDVEFLRNPEQARLLKEEIDPRFWERVDALLEP
ncbi:hypothetical protein GGS23DRAFT_259632 [Durotheca rogersii]|uniref:uncharacterized protein n=1 Tax=Durotheca rogersii TaxID=419775 RepID=UPI00221F9E55|nr:uncharacterized protein GGS23DRAFT_259632 [Durotheca rogersii]KAI5859767.1 hypothetical protein GGS23DRAFT_259632 [Durotheca rogersii]